MSSITSYAMDPVKSISITPVAFIKRGFDEYDGEPMYSIQFFLFTELVETPNKFQKRDILNIFELTPEKFNHMEG